MKTCLKEFQSSTEFTNVLYLEKYFKQNFKTFKCDIYPPEKSENIKKIIKKKIKRIIEC